MNKSEKKQVFDFLENMIAFPQRGEIYNFINSLPESTPGTLTSELRDKIAEFLERFYIDKREMPGVIDFLNAITEDEETMSERRENLARVVQPYMDKIKELSIKLNSITEDECDHGHLVIAYNGISIFSTHPCGGGGVDITEAECKGGGGGGVTYKYDTKGIEASGNDGTATEPEDGCTCTKEDKHLLISWTCPVHIMPEPCYIWMQDHNTEPEDEWEDGDPIHPGPYWLWADFNSFEGDQDGKDLTIGQWNGEKWVTRSDGIPMYWIKVIKWKPYEEIWPSPPLQQEDK